MVANDTLTAEYFSNLLGVATAENQSIKTDAGIDGELNCGQKNVGSIKRNLLNSDEILRLPTNKVLVNLRGNKPILLDKMIYTEHPLAKNLKEDSIENYIPSWNKSKEIIKNEQDEKIKVHKQEKSFDDF